MPEGVKHGFSFTMGSLSALGNEPDRFELEETDLLLENLFLSGLEENFFSHLSLCLLDDLCLWGLFYRENLEC